MSQSTAPLSTSLDVGPAFLAHLQSRSPLPFRHHLTEDPALELESIAELSESLGPESVTCEQAVKPLVFEDGAPEVERVTQAADVVRNLEHNESWLTLLNIEQHQRYRALIDREIDALAVMHHMRPKSLRRRMGFLFASSPKSVTGAHFDIEHSLLLQLRGHRVLSFGEWPDQETRDREVSRYWNGSYGKLTTMPRRLFDVEIGPGDGVYIPPYRPHWLQNSDMTSLSLTITFFTRSNENESFVQAFNERVRRLGLHPSREGTSPLRDNAKALTMRGYGAVRHLRRSATPTPR